METEYRWCAPRWRGLVAGGIAAMVVLSQAGPVFAHGQQRQGNGVAQSGTLQGTLYYTRFVTQDYPSGNYGGTGDPVNVKSVPFYVHHGHLRLGQTQAIAQVPAADGVAVLPSGNLLVGGQFTGDVPGSTADNFVPGGTANVYDVNPQSGQYRSIPAGTPSAFMIGISPNDNLAYLGTFGNRSQGKIGVVGLQPTVHPVGTITVNGGPGVAAPDPNVDAIAFANGQAYYTSSLPDAPGDFGTINLQTGQETQLLTNVPAAHGMVFDPYSGMLVLTGMNEIAQINPQNPTQIASSTTVALTGPNPYFNVFDLPWADGQGQLFAAANNGQLVFLNYAKSGLVGSASTVQTVTVDTYLDDVVGVLGPSTTPPANCKSGSGDPDQNGDVHSDNHHGKGEDVQGQEQPHGFATCCSGGDPDQNGDVHSDNHHGKGEDVNGNDSQGHGAQNCGDPDHNGDVHSNGHNGHGQG